MVAKVLVDADIQSGRKLIDRLDEANVSIKAAFWLYRPDFQRYQLLLASPVYDKNGPGTAYQVLVDAINTLPREDQSRLHEVRMVGESNELVRSLSNSVHLEPGTAGIRYSGSPGREYVDDAWIYRLN